MILKRIFQWLIKPIAVKPAEVRQEDWDNFIRSSSGVLPPKEFCRHGTPLSRYQCVLGCNAPVRASRNALENSGGIKDGYHYTPGVRRPPIPPEPKLASNRALGPTND